MPNTQYIRRIHLRRLWKQGLVGKGIAALWLAYGVLAAIRGDLIPAPIREQYTLAAVSARVLSIHFSWWVTGALVIGVAWLFESSFREARDENAAIADLRSQLYDRAKRQTAIDELWRLRAAGIILRNEEITDQQFPDWDKRWHRWRDDVWGKADLINPNLKNWLEYLDQARPPPSRNTPYRNPDHQRLVTIGSEMLLRMQEFLEREIK